MAQKKIKKLDIYITLRYIISNFAIARCDISYYNTSAGFTRPPAKELKWMQKLGVFMFQ